MATTLTATMVPSSAKTWVMPTLRPINPMVIARSSAPGPREQARSPAPAQPGRGQGEAEHRSERTPRCVSEGRRRQRRHRAGSAGASSHLDFDVDAGGQRKPPERVDRLRGWVEDVDQPLVGADLELLPRVLVDERGPQDSELLDARGQRHRTDDVRAGPLGSLDDLGRRLIEQSVVVCLEADPDPLLCHRVLLDDADDGHGADGPATLADGEALADLEGDRGDELDRHLDVVAGNDPIRTVGQA